MENAKAAGGKAAAAGKKKVRGRKGQGGNAKDDDKERIDGRAGPRSENVVLSKSESNLQLSHLQSFLYWTHTLSNRHLQSLVTHISFSRD